MFDIVIQPSIIEFDGTNILLACLAGHLTIFAFGYPYIYRAISNLSNISNILTERIKNNIWRNLYSKFIVCSFVINLFSLLKPNSEIISIILCVFLFLHIIYVMKLYKIIENVAIKPFEIVINKNINETNFKITKPKELENDIILVIDLICYTEKNSFNEPNLHEYFSWLINVSFFNFKKYDLSNFDYFFGVLPQDQKILYFTLFKLQWLNQWAVNEKKITTLDYIDNAYSWLLEYGMDHPKGFNDKAYPILKTINNIEELKKEYIEISDNTRRATIKKHCDLVKRIQNKLLEQIEQISLYRINNNFISSGEINFFVELLYFILSRAVIEKQDVKYEPCFSIIASIINNNVLDKHYQEIIERIKKHHDYFYGKDTIYGDICGFHINVMAYLIFKNQYQTLKSYMYYEEPSERVSQHTRPQIPNSINNILWNFMGHCSVFYNTQTFSANTSSYRYKFYVLFLLLMYSKNFADKNKEKLSKFKKDDWRYESTEKDIVYHSKCTIDFKNMNFDILMSYLSIEDYKKYLEDFKKETELLNLFDFNNEDEQFIVEVLDDTIKQVKHAQTNLLKCRFKNTALKEFSLPKQKEIGVKNLNELINAKIHAVFESIQTVTFSCNDDDLESHSLNLYDKIHSKKRILSGGYQYLFNNEPMDDFYRRMFNLLIDNCQNLSSIDNIPTDIENYEILSNFKYRSYFEKFGLDKTNIKVEKTIVNGVETDDFEHADVCSLKINNKDIKVSKYNKIFDSSSINDTHSHVIILFNPEKISVKVGEGQPIQYNDLKGGKVQIIDNTVITINIPEDKKLGYYIIKHTNL